MKVPVTLEIDLGTKAINPKVFSPSAAELVKKQLGVEKGSGKQKLLLIGNASIEDIISVAKSKFNNLLCRDLKSAVRTIAGSCVSLGVLIESKPAKEIEIEIQKGKYDQEIKNEVTKTSEEKRKSLNAFFSEIEKKQAAFLAELAKKQEAAATAVVPAASTPAAAAAASSKPAEEK